jgi:purine-binding chemotaxis protein CheW
MEERKYKIGVVGGGKGGHEVLGIFCRTSLATVEYVCDLNPEAPAMVEAAKLKIPAVKTLEEAFAIKVDFVIEVTGSAKVAKLVRDASEQHGFHSMNYDAAMFMFELSKDPAFGIDFAENTLKDRFMGFRVGEEDFGIEIARVTEIANAQKITKLPDLPNYVRGVVNMRGNVFPVIDLRKRFHLEKVEDHDKMSVVIVTIGDRMAGLLVDQMSGVLTIPAEQIVPPPELGGQGRHHFVSGIGKVNQSVTMILNVDEILHENEWDEAHAATAH